MGYPAARALTRISEHYRDRDDARRAGLRYHGGTDIALNTEGKKRYARGEPVYLYAVGAGVVESVNLGDTRKSGVNVYLRLDGDGSRWWYNHNARNLVRPGQRLRDLEPIAVIGATGNVTGPHCHLERHWPRRDVETNPWPYIKDEPDIDGNTSSWQTGTQPAGKGDADTIKEDDVALTSKQEQALNWIADRAGALDLMQSKINQLYDRRSKIDKLDGIATAVDAPAPPVDVTAIADAIIAQVGEGMAGEVADELGKRILNRPGNG